MRLLTERQSRYCVPMAKEKLPRYRLLEQGSDHDLEDRMNELADQGYRVIHFKDHFHWSEEDGYHGGQTVLMERLAT